jgi:hypothetical protein
MDPIRGSPTTSGAFSSAYDWSSETPWPGLAPDHRARRGGPCCGELCWKPGRGVREGARGADPLLRLQRGMGSGPHGERQTGGPGEGPRRAGRAAGRRWGRQPASCLRRAGLGADGEAAGGVPGGGTWSGGRRWGRRRRRWGLPRNRPPGGAGGGRGEGVRRRRSWLRWRPLRRWELTVTDTTMSDRPAARSGGLGGAGSPSAWRGCFSPSGPARAPARRQGGECRRRTGSRRR